MPKSRGKPGFDAALRELEKLVGRMEDGELTLEESLKLYARGMELSRLCREALDEAEQRVEVLTREGVVAPLEAGAADHEHE